MAKTINDGKDIKEGDYVYAPDDNGRLVLGKVITPPPKRLKKSFYKKQEDDPKVKPKAADYEDDPNHNLMTIETHRGHSVHVKPQFAFSAPIENETESDENETDEKTTNGNK